jgi:hypothetical protein
MKCTKKLSHKPTVTNETRIEELSKNVNMQQLIGLYHNYLASTDVNLTSVREVVFPSVAERKFAFGIKFMISINCKSRVAHEICGS